MRTSGHLLLGVVRIHEDKQKVLFVDCSDALVKLKQAFRPGVIDLPAAAAGAQFHAVTIAEHFTTFDVDTTGLDGDHGPPGLLHVGNAADITMAEDALAAPMDLGGPIMEGFGDDMVPLDIPFFDGGLETGRASMEVEAGRDAGSALGTPLAAVDMSDGGAMAAMASTSLDITMRDPPLCVSLRPL